MKCQSEIIWIGLIVIFTSLIISLLIYYLSNFSLLTQEKFYSAVQDENILKILSSLYTSKVPIVQKSVLHIAIDSMLSQRRIKGEQFKNLVYYGEVIATLNSSDFIYHYFDNYIGKNRWQLIVYYDKDIYNFYGYQISGKNVKSYVLPIPVPDEEVRLIVLRIV